VEGGAVVHPKNYYGAMPPAPPPSRHDF